MLRLVIREVIVDSVHTIVAVLFGHAIHALREEYSESSITVKEADELQQCIEALASELTRVQQDVQQGHLLNVRQGAALTAVKEEVQTALASLTPDRLTDYIETLLQERINVSLTAMKPISPSKVSPETHETVSGETSHIRLLTPQEVSLRDVRPTSETTGDSTNLARIYALLNEDRSRKPAEIQRLTGISKATVYRLVERYHHENPIIEVRATSETKSNEARRDETETAS
jgi:hypothetical protein